VQALDDDRLRHGGRPGAARNSTPEDGRHCLGASGLGASGRCIKNVILVRLGSARTRARSCIS